MLFRSQLAGLMGGGNVAALVPNGILPKTALTLQSVHYTLFTSTQTIGALSFSVGFGSASAPQTWVIAQIGSSPLCVTLEKITFDFADPAHPVASGRVMVFGSVTIGEVDLEVQIGFPDFNFAIEALHEIGRASCRERVLTDV